MTTELAIGVGVKSGIEVQHVNDACMCSSALVKLYVMVMVNPNHKGTNFA